MSQPDVTWSLDRLEPSPWKAELPMTVRRLKTYTAATGYVYQYYFVGKRLPKRTSGNEPPATEYEFDVSADRKTTHPVRVLLPPEVVRAWADKHGRSLSDAEQYAAVKMRLFQGFDELAELATQGRTLEVNTGELEFALETLGVD
jgi:hypothetical protein